ncbi:unnamed protein product [Owenia fusiformis]|uniref:Uncharacterized protein n=1 Tax=Owenia fusiformis TaxID=6347 RepID=A0A8J1U4A9_OWEFU|nr:unnamed protein product [Owenia fusiformis]
MSTEPNMSGTIYDSYWSRWERLREKLLMRDLNSRFGDYCNRVKELKHQYDTPDSMPFLASIKILEDEVLLLRKSYEHEIDNIRRELDDFVRLKNFYAAESDKNHRSAVDLQDRLYWENDRNKRANDEVNVLSRNVAQRDQELHDAKMAIRAPMEELAQTKRLADEYSRQNGDLKYRYEAEQRQRLDAEDRCHHLKQKIDFDTNMHAKEIQELKDRLNQSATTILHLESKIRQLSVPDTTTPEVIQRVRDTAEAEIRRYQTESEEVFNRNMTQVQHQMLEDNRKIENLTTDNARHMGEIDTLQAQIRGLQREIQVLDHQKGGLETALNNERIRAQENVRSLQNKMQSLQQMLLDKMREVNVAKDAQVPMKTEIESYRAILEAEERRLGLPWLPPPHPPIAPLPPVTSSPAVLAALTSPRLIPSPPLRIPLASPPVKTLTNVNINDLPMPPKPLRPAPQKTSYIVGPVPQSESPRGPSPILDPVQRSSVERPSDRAKSAPGGQRSLPVVPTNLGQGKDYFDEMFNDLKRTTLKRPQSSPAERPETSTSHDYTTATSSATGNMKILEVNRDGQYIRLLNDSEEKDYEIGGFMLQQNVGGHPVAVYRFPPRVTFKANTTTTVYSGTNDPILHQPPESFVWKEQEKWGTGAECTTILCKPNGQAIAWTTAAHRFANDAYEMDSQPGTSTKITDDVAPDTFENQEPDQEYRHTGDVYEGRPGEYEGDLTEINTGQINQPKPEPVYLKREKAQPPSLSPPKHPYGQAPPFSTHPHSSTQRPYTMGNDNSSVNRQSRSQTTRPDPIQGQPYAGASGARMGSASLRRPPPMKETRSGNVANKSAGTIRYGYPTPFLSPYQQDFSERYDSGRTSIAPQSQIPSHLRPQVIS